MKKLEIQKLHIDISFIKYINKVKSKTTESQNITVEMTKKIKNTFGKQEISKVRVKKIDEAMAIDSFSFIKYINKVKSKATECRVTLHSQNDKSNNYS